MGRRVTDPLCAFERFRRLEHGHATRCRRRVLRLALVAMLAVGGVNALAQAPFITVASTTSTEQSGLFAHLLPQFTRASGIDVRVVAVGTGQALDIGRRGDADVVFVHDEPAEERFVAQGYGLKRAAVMFNDFVLVGPQADPAGVRGRDVVAALKKLTASSAAFVSRGDKSGTHAAELRYWQLAGIEAPAAAVGGRGFDYRACGCGMGPALNIASSTDAYVLADRGTWLNFKNRGRLAILVEGDTRLFNQYGVIVVDPARHPQVRAALAQVFADWLTGPAGQAAIGSYRIGGEPVFFANARR